MLDEDQKNAQTEFKIVDRRGQAKESDHALKPQPEPAAQPKAQGPQQGPKPSGAAPRGKPGSIDFSTFVLSMSTSAIMHMGLIEDQQTGKVQKNLPLAKQEVDIIEMLAEKTKGNLTPQEADMMEQVLYELRLRFVEASKA